ncbi:MAG: phytanoyl-CoA dioxygenase family protein [Mycobacteriaceae bacterium]|nr:phytanoyl-CoA dioxygenase family protein [Mycobacteriaceae bacterium]MBV9641387.1 phytanoyl-CoA dioxygenase family protein [Mycobacteriaceae bacterium]
MSAATDPLEENIVISEHERRSGRLSAENSRLGTLLLHARGYVIITGAIPDFLLAQLQSRFQKLFDESLRYVEAGLRETPPADRPGAASVFWVRRSRFRIFPKLSGPFGDPYVLRNPFADPIIAETLGADYYCKSLSSDTCVKGSIRQGPHRDIGFYGGDGVTGCLVNIAISDCGLRNGPIEVWPGGSHLWRAELFERSDLMPFIQDDANPPLEAFAAHLTSKLIELRPGDLMIRDPGMLHRGTPNPTDEPRTMLTAGYFRNDYYYPYGDTRNNLDEGRYEGLDPAVRQLFSPFFDETDPRYRKLRESPAVPV